MKYVSEDHFRGMSKGILRNGDVLVVKDGATTGKVGFFPYDRPAAVNEHVFVLRTKESVDCYYLYLIVRSDPFQKSLRPFIKGIIGGISLEVRRIKIPLPPLEVQREIVSEIEGYQKVIDGARAVIDNYRPHIPIDPEWPLVEIGELCSVVRGASPRPIREFTTDSPDGVNWIKIGDAEIGAKYITSTKARVTPEGAAKSRRVNPGDFILSNSMSFGRPYVMAIEGCIHDGWLLLRGQTDRVDQDFLYYILCSDHVFAQFERAATGGVVNNLNSKLVRGVKIPLPQIDVQKSIVSEIEFEQALVDANRDLIDRFEQKIQAAIARVWDMGRAWIAGDTGDQRSL